MALVLGTIWAEQRFDKVSRPSVKELRLWIRKRRVRGEVIGITPYIETNDTFFREEGSLLKTGSKPGQRESAVDEFEGNPLLAGGNG